MRHGAGAVTGLRELLDREPEMAVDRLADRLWTVSDGDHRTIFAEGDASVVAVNTFGTPGAARAYRRAIEATVPGKPVGTIVCTTDHLDHTGWGSVLAPDAEVVAHELTARVIAGRGAGGQSPVTRVLHGEGGTVELDGLELGARYAGPTVGSGNLALEVPGTGALFVVGPRADARYGLFADFHFRHYTSVMRRLFGDGLTTVVPGRSRPMTLVEARRGCDYVEALQDACQHAFANGVPIWEYEPMRAYASEALEPKFGDLEGFARHIGIGAIRVVHHYLTGGWGLEDTTAPERLLT